MSFHPTTLILNLASRQAKESNKSDRKYLIQYSQHKPIGINMYNSLSLEYKCLIAAGCSITLMRIYVPEERSEGISEVNFWFRYSGYARGCPEESMQGNC